MKKTTKYENVRFDARTFAEIDKQFRSFVKKPKYVTLSVGLEDANWSFDTFEEFLAAAGHGPAHLHFMGSVDGRDFAVVVYPASRHDTIITVEAPTREEVESFSEIFRTDVGRCRIPEEPKEVVPPKVFVGHGRDPQWRDLKDHLHEKHGYPIEAYEIGSRAGHAIRDILEEMLEGSTVALLVMTGEDETKDGKVLARQNVVHEAGLFQGKLGFSRAIILLEDGTEEFSNIHGLQQIRFSKGNIKESFGEVLAVLKREIG